MKIHELWRLLKSVDEEKYQQGKLLGRMKKVVNRDDKEYVKTYRCMKVCVHVPLVDVLLLSQPSRYESDGRKCLSFLREVVCQRKNLCSKKKVVWGRGVVCWFEERVVTDLDQIFILIETTLTKFGLLTKASVAEKKNLPKFTKYSTGSIPN